MTVLRLEVDAHDLSLLSRALTDLAAHPDTPPADKIDALHLMDRIAHESASAIRQQQADHGGDKQKMSRISQFWPQSSGQ